MQFATASRPPARSGEWIRKRQCWRLYKLTYAPVASLHGTEHDAWSFDPNKGPVFTTNPVWEAAVKESERRLDLYNRMAPLSKWGLS